ncbi:MAG: sigma-54 dependent transcriptional regulator [Thermodesulfovibrionales bacterium]
MNTVRILVVDDEEIVRQSCSRVLSGEGYRVDTAATGSEGLRRLATAPYDLVLTDLMMPDMDGIEVLRRTKETSPETEVVIMTGYGTVKAAVKAMKAGAFEFIEKPFIPEELIAVVSKSLTRKRLALESLSLRSAFSPHYRLDNIVGASPEMQKVFHLISRVAHTTSTALVTGESGTGKELVAKAIHYNSPRKDQPLVVVDCTAMPAGLIESELFGHAKGAFTGAHERKKGLLEAADGGSLFLDEIGNLDSSVQAKLLRVLQEKEFRPVGDKNARRADVRFIAATNRDLHRMTREGTFREDFFFRLNIFPIHLPPLRERKEDIPHLAYHFLKRYAKELDKQVGSITADAMKLLVGHAWPGNVRQMENTIQRAVILCQDSTIRPEHLTPLLEDRPQEAPMNLRDLKKTKKQLKIQSTEHIEKTFLIEALKRTGGNVSRAAAEVGMQRTNFHALLRKHNIKRDYAGKA